jgi:hypothetical protein
MKIVKSNIKVLYVENYDYYFIIKHSFLVSCQCVTYIQL